MARIKAERVAYLAVGIPDNHTAEWCTREAIRVLQARGFAVTRMTPDDITAQARHIEQTIEKAKEQTA